MASAESPELQFYDARSSGERDRLEWNGESDGSLAPARSPVVINAAPAPGLLSGDMLGTLVRLALAFFMPPAAPDDPVMRAAQVRLLMAQAEALERQADALVDPKPEPRFIGDLLPARFDMVICGERGSGKSRAVSWFADLARRAGVPCAVCDLERAADLPDFEAATGLLILEEAGVAAEIGGKDAPVAWKSLRRALAKARERNLSTIFVAQHTSQVPLAITRHGVFLLVTEAGWMWRAQAREELRDRLDAAHKVLKRARGRVAALVDPDGWVDLVEFPGWEDLDDDGEDV